MEGAFRQSIKKESFRRNAGVAASPFSRIRAREVAVQPKTDSGPMDWRMKPKCLFHYEGGFFPKIDRRTKELLWAKFLGRLRTRNPRTCVGHRIHVPLTPKPNSFPRKIDRTCLPKRQPEKAQEKGR